MPDAEFPDLDEPDTEESAAEESAAEDPGDASPSRGDRVAAVVLAAGEGSRFRGGPKLLAPFRGRPLVAWTVRAALDSGLDAVVVVSGAVDVRSELELELELERLATSDRQSLLEVVENPRWHAGQASSLRTGLDWCLAREFDAAVVGLADQPLVPASAWHTVGRAYQAPIVSATFDGHRRPPVRLHRSIWSLLEGVGDEGARALMRERPDLVGEVACEGDPADVDTLDDLRRLDPSGE